MACRLRVDTGALCEAGTSLRSVATEFDGANVTSDQVAGAVGHAGLAAAVRCFAHGWDGRRAGMVESMAALADACSGIGDAFAELDSQLAAALRGER